MERLTQFITKIANWKSLLFFLVFFFSFNLVILKNAEEQINNLAENSVGVIDLTKGFNPQRTLKMVEDYGAEARSYYAKVEMTADVVYPLVYAFLFGIILALIYKEKFRTIIITLPFYAMIFDLIENTAIVILLKTFPDQSLTMAIICEIFKLLKWLSLGIIILAFIGALISKLKVKFEAKN